jgi:hypothetical protein
LAAVGELPLLQTLALNGWAFGSNMKTLVEALVEQKRLRELDLFNCPIGDDGAGHLATMLERNRSLSVLNVQCCEFGDAGLVQLGRALTRNTTLRQLDLMDNEFTPEGVVSFAGVMGDMHGLQVLQLDRNWHQQLLPGIEGNYSLLKVEPSFPAAQPLLQRNARGYAKVRAATLAWLCICRRRPFGLLSEIGLIIARHIYASCGWSCWTIDDEDSSEDDAK